MKAELSHLARISRLHKGNNGIIGLKHERISVWRLMCFDFNLSYNGEWLTEDTGLNIHIWGYV
jgi:hypothetical protein